MPRCDQWKYVIELEGQFVGYGCEICRQLGTIFEVRSLGYRGCGRSCSGGVSSHIYHKHKIVLDRGFIVFCKDCDLQRICHEPLLNLNPQECLFFRPAEKAHI